MNFKKLSSLQLHEKTIQAARIEKQATHQLLLYLGEVLERKVFLERGYSSLFTYVRDALGYSESAAWERCQATRLLIDLPELKSELEEGSLTLTGVAKTAAVLRRAEKVQKVTLTHEFKRQFVHSTRGKTKRQLEEHLFQAEVSLGLRAASSFRMLTIEVTPETLQMLERYQELRGRSNPGEIFQNLLSDFLRSKDLLSIANLPVECGVKNKVKKLEDLNSKQEAVVMESEVGGSKINDQIFSNMMQIKYEFQAQSQSTARSASSGRSRYIPLSARRLVLKRAGGKCEYTDPITGKRCAEGAYVQFDHYPKKFRNGGVHSSANLRILCSAHNRAAG